MRATNDDEKKAIAALQRLARTWPRTLWLFAANGTLNVMRYTDDGDRTTTPDQGMDPEYSVATVPIPADGGDW